MMPEPISYQSVESVLDPIVEQSPDALSRTDLLARTASALHVPGERLEELETVLDRAIDSHPSLFRDCDCVFPLHAFFRGAQFRLALSRIEREQSLLIPGAAFVPFVSDEIFPDDFTLSFEGHAEPLRLVRTRVPFRDLEPAFRLMGRSGMIDHLTAESQENYHVFTAGRHFEDRPMEVSAFDLSPLLKTNRFSPDSELVVSVEDWRSGRFSLRPAKSVSDETRSAWFNDFDAALLDVCAQFEDYLEMSQQIAYAYFAAFRRNTDLRSRPDASLAEYEHRMADVGIRRDGSEWLFVPADHLDAPGFHDALHDAAVRARSDRNSAENDSSQDAVCSCRDPRHEHAHAAENALGVFPDSFSVSSGTLESLDGILAELQAPLNRIEVCSLIASAIANGDESFHDFQARLMESLRLSFADDAQEAAFLNLLEEEWESAYETFRPERDLPKEELRSRLLDVTDERVRIARALLARYGTADAIPPEILRPMLALHKAVFDTLALLDSDADLPEGDDLDALELRIADIEEQCDVLAQVSPGIPET